MTQKCNSATKNNVFMKLRWKNFTQEKLIYVMILIFWYFLAILFIIG